MPKFLHFGCWNKGGCFLNDDTEQTSNLTNVMRLLNKVVDKTEYKFISVAGDNYYPTKIKNGKMYTKIYDKEELTSGFNCLPKDTEINVIMGNHDYEKELNQYNDNREIIEISGCEILNTEYQIMNETVNNNINVSMYKSIDVGSTKIIMIDTTIYDDDYIGQNIDCYLKHPDLNELFNNDDSLDTKVSRVRNNQQEFINSNIRTLQNEDNLIIIGHHPITGLKYKKDKLKLIESPGGPFINMLYNTIHLQLKYKNIKYYYLCADLHQYQIGNISICPNEPSHISDCMFIKQYIVGTGGADLDPYYSSLMIPDEINYFDNLIENKDNPLKVSYLMTDEEIKLSGYKFGILECNIENKIINFNFLNINEEDNKDDKGSEINPEDGINILKLQQSGGTYKRKRKIITIKNLKNNYKSKTKSKSKSKSGGKYKYRIKKQTKKRRGIKRSRKNKRNNDKKK